MRQKTFILGTALVVLLTTGATAASAHENIYKVSSGDSLWKIATANGITVENIKNWNNLSNDTIYVGQALSLLQPHTHEITYYVRSGDTLALIAKNNNVLIADIKILNHLSNDSIYVGQKLLIPTAKGVYSTHTVQSGEYLYLIARDYGITVTDLRAWNNLTTDMLNVGQVLNVSKPVSVSAPTPATTTVPTSEENSQPVAIIHTVQAGEYLGLIAKKYNTTVDKIKQLNGLTTDIIYVGQKLKVSEGSIPAPAAPAFLQNGIFPLKAGTYQPFGDTWGDSRAYGGDRAHEGTDIMAAKGTPVYSATDGIIVNYGWSDLGGWRITIKSPEGYNLYYAHLSKYVTGLGQGITVQKGQMIGYVGDSGYGPEGTTGQFAPHLHFGIYNSSWAAINPYEHLRYWESKLN